MRIQVNTLHESCKGPCAFSEKLATSGLIPFVAQRVEILQINVGKLCNLSCRHCHLEAGPEQTEIMPKSVLEQCLLVAHNPAITTIDITGGAPELNPHVAWFIDEVSRLKKRLIVRSNLVILDTPPYNEFIDLYASHNVELVASLPDLHASKTNRQRGEGVFEREIAIIKALNNKGYGHLGSDKILDLVHNPVGAFLPGSQHSLQSHYKQLLHTEYGILFNALFCITNVPIGRYKSFLLTSNNYDPYMSTLKSAFNPIAATNAMCRSTISVGWDGSLYDCDFNLALEAGIKNGAPRTIFEFDSQTLSKREIAIDDHCFACTAGAGSSCQGATSP